MHGLKDVLQTLFTNKYCSLLICHSYTTCLDNIMKFVSFEEGIILFLAVLYIYNALVMIMEPDSESLIPHFLDEKGNKKPPKSFPLS